MREPRVGTKVVQRPEHTGLHVHRTEDDPTDPTLLGGTSTHGARFEGDDQCATLQSPRTECLGRVAQRQYLGVRGGVAGELTFVVPRCEHRAIGPEHDCADGNVVVGGGLRCFVEGTPHEFVVGHGAHRSVELGYGRRMTELSAETVDRYLARIGLEAAPAPTVAGLTTLMQAHLSTVPFEALDVFVGRRVPTSLDHSIAKIVGAGRGGWCFENNGAFAGLLRALGFDVLQVGAAVLLDGPNSTIDHLCLEVTLDGSWLVDVGFGDSFTVPLDLNDRGPQAAPDATYELIDSSQGLTLTRHDAEGVPVPQYRFRRVHHPLDDFTPASDALQDDRTLHWSTKPFATRLLDGGPDRITLLRNRLKFRRDGIETEEPIDEADWPTLLDQWFSMQMPSSPEG